MYSVRLHSWLLVPSFAAVLAIGCGDGNTLSSPTAPSALSDDASLTVAEFADIASTASDAEEAFGALGSGSGNSGSGSSGSGGGSGSGSGNSGSGSSGSGSGNSGGGSSGSGNSGSGSSGSGSGSSGSGSGSGSGSSSGSGSGSGSGSSSGSGDNGNSGPGSGFPDNSGPGRVKPDSVTGIVTAVTRDENENGKIIEITIHGVKITGDIPNICEGGRARVRGTLNALARTFAATEVMVEFSGCDIDEEEDEEEEAEVPTIRVRCETRGNPRTRSKVSVDGNNLAPGTYSAQIESGSNPTNTATSGTQPADDDEVEFDFDSEQDDIADGATAIAADFIQGGKVTGKIRDASGNVVVQAEALCTMR